MDIRNKQLSYNSDHSKCNMAGYRFATGDIIVSMDDDGQTPIEEVGALINELEKGYDVVFAKYKTIKQNIFSQNHSMVLQMIIYTSPNSPPYIPSAL